MKNKRNVSGKPSAIVDINILNMLKDLFEKQGWSIDEKSEISTFSRYYETLKLLDKEQQEFLIKISYNFIHIPAEYYIEYLLSPLKRLREDFQDLNLIFVPCLPESDINKIKSSSIVVYQLKGTTIKSLINLSPFFVTDFSNTRLFSSVANSNNNIMVLVDDFIGTGETALGAVDYIHKLIPSFENNQHIVILSIIAMRSGIDVLESQNIKVYTNIICGRGISDKYTGEELVRAESIMRGIEKKIRKLDKKWEFGYKRSEALVCMERCPNNTFPIYWEMKKIAPYER